MTAVIGPETLSRVSAPTGSERGRRGPSRRRQWAGLAFVLPAALYLVVYQLVPVVYGLFLSFTRYNPLSRSAPRFVGLSNYSALWHDPDYGKALLVTGRYVVEVLVPLIVLAVALALVANRSFRGVGLFRASIYLPHVVSLATVSMVWLWMYSDSGLINHVLGFLGLDPQSWLLEHGAALNAVSVMRIWQALGSNMVILLAGLQTIPHDLYDAARCDGAGSRGCFRHITLPGLRPMIIYAVVMDVVYLAQGFSEIFVLTKGGPLASTTTVNYLIYTEAFQYNQFGSASAMAFVLFALIIGFSVLAARGVPGRSS
jgi:multiple sugar transport system permease protein